MSRLWRWIAETFRAVTRPGDAYEEWRRMMDDGIAEAYDLLDKDPDSKKGHQILSAVDHSMACSWAFLFGKKRDA